MDEPYYDEEEKVWKAVGSEGLCPYCKYRKTCPLSPITERLVWGAFSVQECSPISRIMKIGGKEFYIPGFTPPYLPPKKKVD